MSAPRLNVPAVLLGLVALPVLYAVLTVLLNVVVDHPRESPAVWALVAPVGAAILWLAPGFVTGYVAKHSPARHGSALGIGILVAAAALVAIAPLFGAGLADGELPYAIGFVIPIALGAFIGAFIGNWFAKRR